MYKCLIIFLVLFCSIPAISKERNESLIAKELFEELRCLVCQNQSISESDAPLAKDLKLIVIEQLNKGKTKAEVKSFLVDKYGEFILFKPTFSLKNLLLWIAPIIFLIFGIFLTFRFYYFPFVNLKNSKRLTVLEKRKLKSILDEDIK